VSLKSNEAQFTDGIFQNVFNPQPEYTQKYFTVADERVVKQAVDASKATPNPVDDNPIYSIYL
jgi:hypothetical protein